ncbi:MAG TPA: hypothetical protein VE737_01635, partial [Actinomycetota bacterium]|nr:hypothetical protein [Actinomycetota bacterium]
MAFAATATFVLPSPAARASGKEHRRLSTPALIEAARRGGEIKRAKADLFLARALGPGWRLVPERFRSDVPWDGTLPLLRLRKRVANMAPGPARSAIVDELSSEAAGNCSGTSAGPNTHVSTYFSIDYGTVGGGLNINSYAMSLDAARTQEVNAFGWAAPPLFPTAPSGRYHVVVANLAPGLYGFVSPTGTNAGLFGNNPNTSWNDVDAYASCMALNDDYSGFPSPPQASLDATTAHEFNHSIQFGYGALTGANVPDAAFIEGGATWMEDEVFDGANDSYNYLWPNFADDMGSYSLSPYPYWITFRGLTERFGTGAAGAGEQVMQDFWELTSQSGTSNMLSALNQALVNKGTTLADAYHAYAIAAKFNRTCGGGYVYPYCFEEAAGYVAKKGPTPIHQSIATVGGSVFGSLPNHYSLNWVALPNSGFYGVTLRNRSGGGQLRGSVVCDTGSALTVSSLPTIVGPNAVTRLADYDPAGCMEVALIITNEEQTSPNPSMSFASEYEVDTAATHLRTVSLRLRRHLIARGLVTTVDGFGACASGESVRI